MQLEGPTAAGLIYSATSPTAATSTWPGRGYSTPTRSRTRRLDRRAANVARGTAGTST